MEEGFFCQACGTVYDDIMACRICQPKEYAKYFEVCPKCDGAQTARGSCVCDGNGVIPKRIKQLGLFEEDK